MEYQDHKPIFLQVADDILRQLLAGERSPGEKLDSIRDLARVYKVNPNTMQKAMTALEETGLFETRRGLGTFVTEDASAIVARRSELIDEKIAAFLTDIHALGVEGDALIERIRRQETTA